MDRIIKQMKRTYVITPSSLSKLMRETAVSKKTPWLVKHVKYPKVFDSSKGLKNTDSSTFEAPVALESQQPKEIKQEPKEIKQEDLFSIEVSRIDTVQSEEDNELDTLIGSQLLKTLDSHIRRPSFTRQPSPKAKAKFEKKRSEGRVTSKNTPHVFVKLF